MSSFHTNKSVGQVNVCCLRAVSAFQTDRLVGQTNGRRKNAGNRGLEFDGLCLCALSSFHIDGPVG